MVESGGYQGYSGVDVDLFSLPADGAALAYDGYRDALASLRAHVAATKSTFLGYQANQRLDYLHLADLLDVQLNNLGGPFNNGDFRLNTKWVERAVLDYFARLWRAKTPWQGDDPDSYWGYVLSMGSTEGNLYGLWNAREYLSGRRILEDDETGDRALRHAAPLSTSPNEFTPVALFSADIHYSIGKALRALMIPTVGQLAATVGLDPAKYLTGVPTYPEDDANGRAGEINLDDLTDAAEKLLASGYPLLVILNYGTAFRGAYDNVAAAVRAVDKLVVARHGDRHRIVRRGDGADAFSDQRTWVWYHVDGALGAAFAPYLADTAYTLPAFDFSVGVHSISTSGHKWMGAPWPCGVYMTKRDYELRPEQVAYIGGPDTTFAGSRNGLSALILWSYLARTGVEFNRAKAVRLQKLADTAEQRLRALDNEMQRDHGIHLYVSRTRNSLTIRFRKLSDDLIAKYTLSSDRVERSIDRKLTRVNVSHIYCMDHVSEALIEDLVADIRAAGPAAVHPEFLAVAGDGAPRSGAGPAFANEGGGFSP